ncbi:MAG TPA: VOC family protein [Verrucomicrobiota bacterium]|nr:glyoxalase [Verrucomicrobiales bacterium]HRI16380.1 VOC family protein [Verrucomicrobiota bacterium]
MSAPAFHHAQLTVADLERSRAFYREVLGLKELPRPAFPFPGAWFQLANGQELHIVKVPQAPPRGLATMQIYENHLALRVESFPKALELLRAHGYREDVADDDPRKMVIKTHPPTGYPQVYFLDPDRYLFEFNAAGLD